MRILRSFLNLHHAAEFWFRPNPSSSYCMVVFGGIGPRWGPIVFGGHPGNFPRDLPAHHGVVTSVFIFTGRISLLEPHDAKLSTAWALGP